MERKKWRERAPLKSSKRQAGESEGKAIENGNEVCSTHRRRREEEGLKNFPFYLQNRRGKVLSIYSYTQSTRISLESSS